MRIHYFTSPGPICSTVPPAAQAPARSAPGRAAASGQEGETVAEPRQEARRLRHSRTGRRKSPAIVARLKVVKSSGKVVGRVASHSRKVAGESRSLFLGSFHSGGFEVLLLKLLGGHLIAKLGVGGQDHLRLVLIVHVVLHQEDTGDRVDFPILHIVFHLQIEN